MRRVYVSQDTEGLRYIAENIEKFPLISGHALKDAADYIEVLEQECIHRGKLLEDAGWDEADAYILPGDSRHWTQNET